MSAIEPAIDKQHGQRSESTNSPRLLAARRGLRKGVFALERAAGNRAVAALIGGLDHSAGAPLDAATRHEMDARFGQDFGEVRVHTDNAADASTRSLHAAAYTIGHDIVFAAGRYNPRTAGGRRLLAHELAHVVQQRRGPSGTAPNARLEGSAERAAQALSSQPGTVAIEGASGPAIQTYEAGEHAQFGARPGETEKTVMVATSDKKVVTMTYGEMIAMGDLFESPDEMKTVTEKELTILLTLIRRERDRGIGSVSEKDWVAAAGDRYLKLASKNDPHFAPPPGATGFDAGGDNNRHQWWIYHQRALGLAQRKQVDAALAINAFGDHFLTDAFSAGHLLNKKRMMDTAKKKEAGISGFEKKVAKGVLDTPQGAKLRHYDANPGAFSSWTAMTPDSLAAVINRVRYWEGGMFWSNFAKAVHDRLSQDIAVGGSGTKPGIEVTNNKKMTWRLAGDKTLSYSPETLQIAREAVAQSQKNITDSVGKERLDYMAMANAVWDYVPQPTDEGKMQVAGPEKQLLDPSTTEAVDAWVAIIISPSNFDALVKKLVDNGLVRPASKALVPADK